MTMSDALLPEFDHEMANTRKSLERVPKDKIDWKLARPYKPRCATVAPCFPQGPAGTRPRTVWQRALRSAGSRACRSLI